MRQGRSSSYRVIGFEGNAVSHCGFATPVLSAKRKGYADEAPAFLATDGPEFPLPSVELHPHPKEQGRITLFDEPIDIKSPPDQLKSLKAIFVHSILLARIAADLPAQVNGSRLEWRYVYKRSTDIWVAAAQDAVVGRLLDDWHARLLEQADESFRHPAPGLDLWVARTRELCKMLVSVAIGQDRLFKSYLRYGHMLSFIPDGRIDYLRPLIESKLGGFAFKDFTRAVSDYSAKFPRNSRRAPTRTQLLAEELSVRSRIPEMIRRIQKKGATGLSIAACVRFAREQGEEDAPPAAVQNLVNKIDRLSYVRLNKNQDLQILAKDAAAYWRSGLVKPRGAIATLNSLGWYQATQELFSASESETQKQEKGAEFCSPQRLEKFTPLSFGQNRRLRRSSGAELAVGVGA